MDMPVNGEEGEEVIQGARGEKKSFWATWKKRILLWALIIGIYLAVCWILTIYDSILFSQKKITKMLYFHGIIPRTRRGLIPGIIAAPFLHLNFEHMESDTVGVFMLGTTLMLSSFKTFFGVTLFVWLVGGFATWCVGRYASIVGCGILVFGWFGYLIITPFFQRPISIKAISLAAATGILYGGLIFGLFPSNTNVAWEAGICSLLAGILCSVGYWFFYRKYFAKHVEKYAPRLSAHLPTSPQVPFSVKPRSPAFPRATGEGDAAIVPQSNQARFSQPPQKSYLLENTNPFGSQDPEHPATLNSSEPEWLFGSKAAAPPPPTAQHSSFAPSWMQSTSTTQPTSGQEMTSFPTQPVSSSEPFSSHSPLPQQKNPPGWNPF